MQLFIQSRKFTSGCTIYPSIHLITSPMAMTMASEADKGEKGFKVKVLSTSHVKPKKPLGRMECELSLFDLMHLGYRYNQKLLIYKWMSVDEFGNIVERLTDGLRVVLEDFYQLAGTLWKDGDELLKVVYDDDMDGVEVVVAVGEDAETADLMDGERGLKELTPCNGLLNLEGLHQPLLAVQVTKLKDGVAMGCAFNHTILDGTSTWHFMSSWAQICSGFKPTTVQPFLDRTKVRRTHVKPDLTAPPRPEITGPSIRLSTRNFKFSEPTINRVKSKVNANGSKPFSTFQSFTTHVWQAVTRARQLNPEDYVIIGVTVDCRKRVEPPLPESYFGNVVQGTYTMTTAGMLTRNPPEFGAEMIRKVIETHDSEAIGKTNVEWEMKPRTFQDTNAVENILVIGSSPRFKVYDVDFGWGKPEGVRSGLNTRFDGMVYLYQGKSEGTSIDVDISLEANAMKRLEKDQDFLMGV